MPRKPANTMPDVCPRSAPGFSRSAITTAGSSPSATMLQRKNAIENGGTLPATPRARIMLETCAVATRRKPSRPSISRDLLSVSFVGSFMPDLLPARRKCSLRGSVPAGHHGVERISDRRDRRLQAGEQFECIRGLVDCKFAPGHDLGAFCL